MSISQALAVVGRAATGVCTTNREKQWKIIYNYSNEKWELYKLEKDPFEKTDVFARNPEFSRTLARKMIQKLDSMQAQYPVDIKSGKPVKPQLDTR